MNTRLCDLSRRLVPACLALACLALLPLPADCGAAEPVPPGESGAFERCATILKFGDLMNPNEANKVDAVHALGLLGDPRAVPLLVDHLEHVKNDNFRLQIVRALGWIGRPEAVPALERALTDKYPFVRHQSAVALKKITGKDYDYDKTGLPDPEKLRQLIHPANPN